MSETQSSAGERPGLGGEELQSALFAQLVMQQANLALVLLGKTPNPETGKANVDLEAAQLFIDQLEMLEVKTRGNLTKAETGLLKQTLMSLRLAFVEAADTPRPAEAAPKSPPVAPEPAAPAQSASATPPPEEDHRKKFSKKY